MPQSGGPSRAHRDPRDLQRDAGPGQGGRVRLPGHQRHQLRDPQRRAARVRRGRERRHHPGLHRRGGVRVRHRVKDMVTGAVGAGRVRARRRREVPDQRRAAHRPLPEGQARHLRPAADRRQPASGSTAGRTRCSSRTCGTARRSELRREPGDRRRAARAGGQGEDHPRGRDRRRRRRGGRRRQRDQREALHHAGDYEATVDALGGGEKGRYLLAATFGNVHGVYKPGNVKLRPAVLKDGPGGGRRQARPRRGLQAVRPGLPRRLGLAARGDPRGARATASSR